MTTGRFLAWLLAAVLLFAVILGLWVGIRGWMAYRYLAHIEAGAVDGISALSEDPSGAAPVLLQLAADAGAARELTSDPGWQFAERTPWLGPQLAAFSAVAASADDLLHRAVLPLASAAQGVSLDVMKPTEGRVDTSSLAALAAPAREAATTANMAAKSVAEIDRTALVGVVASAVERVEDLFARSAGSLDAFSRAAQLMPGMLGQDGERTYLLLVQNNAEWRSLGGITGVAVLVSADRGKISLLDTESATSLGRGAEGPLPELSDELKSIYDTRPVRYFHNLTQIPDFTVDGPLARDLYERKTGTRVDGVLAVDPVALSYLLGATGPVKLESGESLTSENAVRVLLSDVYELFPDPEAQDSFFANATREVFEALLGGRGSTSGIVRALSRAAEERRLLVWSAVGDEQSVLDSTALSGQLPATDDQTARFGVFFNDATGSKMSYYVKPDVSVAWEACDPNQNTYRRLTLTVRLSNSAPADAATSLPTYVTGNGAHGIAPGVAAVVGNVYLPQGFELLSAETSNGNGFTSGTFKARQVLTLGVNLAPQATETFSVTVGATSPAEMGEAVVTPTAEAALNPTARASCASLGAITVQ